VQPGDQELGYFLFLELFCGAGFQQYSRAGVSMIFSNPFCRTVRCVDGSKLRRVSISSPKNSSRTGPFSAGGQISRIPPRRANCPGAMTVLTFSVTQSYARTRQLLQVSDCPSRSVRAALR